MPAKKAAKKVAAKHADPKHNERKDVRRAYEHLGRVEILSQNGQAGSKDVAALVALAEKELGQGRCKDGADLLRAAEHFSFAAIALSPAKSGKLSPELKEVVLEEYEHLIERAQDHWDDGEAFEHHTAVTVIFESSLKSAQRAIDAGAYREALELARGAEALAHVRTNAPKRLGDGKQKKLLAA